MGNRCPQRGHVVVSLSEGGGVGSSAPQFGHLMAHLRCCLSLRALAGLGLGLILPSAGHLYQRSYPLGLSTMPTRSNLAGVVSIASPAC